MKVSQFLKMSAVVLALGSVPLHTAFADEGDSSNGSVSEQTNGDEADAESGSESPQE